VFRAVQIARRLAVIPVPGGALVATASSATVVYGLTKGETAHASAGRRFIVTVS
jgi:hypothetical protein